MLVQFPVPICRALSIILFGHCELCDDRSPWGDGEAFANRDSDYSDKPVEFPCEESLSTFGVLAHQDCLDNMIRTLRRFVSFSG